MDCLQGTPPYSYSRQRLPKHPAVDLSCSRLPTSAAERIFAFEAWQMRAHERKQDVFNRPAVYRRLAKRGSLNDGTVGVTLLRGEFAGLQTRRNLFAFVFATASPIDLGDDASAQSVPAQKNLADEVHWLDAFHRFSRPHTVIGTAMGVISISLLATQTLSDLSSTFLLGLLQALIPALLMNIYIVGLNQIYDVDIDKVNKPYLPLASGEFSMRTGVAIVTISAALSLGIGLIVGSRPLLWTLLVSLFLGTAYSVDFPFLRWKRSALAAATCILAIRAIVVQLGFYYHMQGFVFGRGPTVSRQLLFATAFMSFLSIVIALAKDLPDVEGDKVYGIRSFSVRLGQRKVFWTCVWLLQAAYAVAMSVGSTSPTLMAKFAMIVGHLGLSITLWIKAKATNLKSKANIVSFYMFVWQLFYAEYIIIPFVK